MGKAMILLVSAQPMANLLAALAPELAVGDVHLLVSGDMRGGGQGDHLADVLAARGLGVHWHDVAEPFQPAATRGIVAQLLAGDPDRFLVNLTGGTKPMSIGAYRAAVDAGVRDILYTDHEAGLMRWLEGNRPPFSVSTALGVGEVVRAHGYTSRSAVDLEESRLDTAFRIDRALVDPGLLQAWNRLMFAVEQRCRHGNHWSANAVPLSAVRSGSPAAVPFDENALSPLLADAAGHGFLALGKEELTIADPDAHAFLAGGWWELVVWKALGDQAKALGLDDLVRNLEVTDTGGASNEVDIAAMRGRNLLLFECKTVRLTGSDTREKASNILYKLEHLARLGGLGTRLFLVSRERLNGKIRKRFEAEKVGLVDGVSTSALPGALARIIAAA